MSEKSEPLAEMLQRVLEEESVTDRRGADRAARAAGLLAEYYRLREGVQALLRGPDEQADEDLSGQPLHEAARRVLARAGMPLHAGELGRRIKARGWRHPRSRHAGPDLIMFQLAARLPKHPGVFRRVAPNTFALAEWDESTLDRPRPRTGVFRGPGRPVGREIGESDEPLRSAPWRSS